MAELFDSLPVAPVLSTFMQYFIAFCSRPEAYSEIIPNGFEEHIVADKYVKFRDPRLHHSGVIRPKLSDSAFSPVIRTLINADCKQLVTSYPLRL